MTRTVFWTYPALAVCTGFVALMLISLSGGCPAQQDYSSPTSAADSDRVVAPPNSAGGPIDILFAGGLPARRVAASAPQLASLSFQFPAAGGLFPGTIGEAALRCTVLSESGLSAVRADLRGCGGPSDANLADAGAGIFAWSGTLAPSDEGLARCGLTMSPRGGLSARTQPLLVFVDGSGNSQTVTPPIEATDFVVCVIEPLDQERGFGRFDLDINDEPIVQALQVQVGQNEQRTLELAGSTNLIAIRGRDFSNVLRVRFFQGLQTALLFDGVVILPIDRQAVFQIRRTYTLTPVVVSSAVPTITIWDYAVQDGDRIDLFVNNQLVLRDRSLTNAPYTFSPQLQSGVNDIRIRALNEGSLRPNTAAISVSDTVSGPASQTWGLSTNQEATLQITVN